MELWQGPQSMHAAPEPCLAHVPVSPPLAMAGNFDVVVVKWQNLVTTTGLQLG